MKSNHTSYKCLWLTEQGLTQPATTTDVPSRLIYPLAPEIGSGWLDTLKLSLGMTLFHGACEFSPAATGKLIPLMEFNTTYPERTFSVHSLISGGGCHHERFPECDLIYSSGYDLVRYAEQAAAKVVMDASRDIEMVSVSIGRSTMNTLLGDDQTEALLSNLDISEPPKVLVKEMPRFISSTLASAISYKMTGPAQLLFAQAKVIEYLGALITHYSAETTISSTPHRERIHELHDFIINLEGKIPNLEELAKAFRMPARRLNQEFSKEFGQSIFTFITSYRLDQAHKVLAETDVPIKRLALNLGYSHVNHFNTAFKRKFGYPPGSLRGKQRTR